MKLRTSRLLAIPGRMQLTNFAENSIGTANIILLLACFLGYITTLIHGSTRTQMKLLSTP